MSLCWNYTNFIILYQASFLQSVISITLSNQAEEGWFELPHSKTVIIAYELLLVYFHFLEKGRTVKEWKNSLLECFSAQETMILKVSVAFVLGFVQPYFFPQWNCFFMDL